MSVCALDQDQGLLLASSGELVWSNGSCLITRCRSSRDAG
jgi:hypothetical protein